MKVDVLVATYRHINSNAFACIQKMIGRTRREGVDVEVPALHGSSLVHRARNQALTAIRTDAQYVLLCDDDMTPEPDALLRLLGHGCPVISALTTTREMPPKLTPTVYNAEKDWLCPLTRTRPGAVLDGAYGVGTGFLLIAKPTLDAAVEFHLSGRDWLADNRMQLDRLHVRNEAREKERAAIEEKRRKIAAEKNYTRLFYYSVHDGQEEFGEDNTLCRNLIRMGVPIRVDTSVQVGHIGDFPYGPWNMDDFAARDIVFDRLSA